MYTIFRENMRLLLEHDQGIRNESSPSYPRLLQVSRNTSIDSSLKLWDQYHQFLGLLGSTVQAP